GEEWKTISPDLSAHDPEKTGAVGSGAENYAVVYSLAESPLAKGLLWAGTDDGKVWVTEDEGANWTDLTSFLPAAVKGQWVSRLEAGQHDAKVAYLAVDAHRTGNLAPLAYRTADKGRTWQSIAGNLPANGPVKVIREDPKNPHLLYAGTELGAFVSVDLGRQWTKLDLPTVAVDALLVHPRDNDLVIATHGRSLYILDDVAPLQALTAEVLAKDAYLFAPRAAVGFHPFPGWADWAGNSGIFRGDNPPVGAALTYYVRDYAGETVKIAVKDQKGRPVANLKGPDGPGLHRVVWDLKPTKDVLTEYGGEGSRFMPPGEYKLTLTRGKATSEQTVKVELLPGVETR
ncbi:MAG: WD40/YVTN/BNR-like repeat-containing protein, partial [bacterium]